MPENPESTQRDNDIRPGDPADAVLPRLIDREGGRLYALGLRFCGSETDAADLVQETFLSAFKYWDTFKGEASVSSWLYRIAANACKRMHRKRSGEPATIAPLEGFGEMADGPIGDPRAVEDQLDEQVRREAVRDAERAIADLPLDYRMPLVLKEIVGLSVLEVASILGLKDATVKTRLHRARLALRDAIESSLPKRDLPPPIYEEAVCMDLLRAKQEAMDRGVSFPVANEVMCDRCRAVFAGMDLAQDTCRRLARGELPERLRARLLAEVGGARDG